MTTPANPSLSPKQEAATLVAAIAAGDDATISGWHQAEHPRLMAVAMRVVRDRVRAAEVVQSAFLRALASLATFRGDAQLGTWLSRITHRLALNEHRRSRRDEARNTSLDLAATRPGHDERPVDSPITERVRDAVNALPDSLRLPLILSEIEGYTHAEIAHLLHITAAASRVRATRARNILRVTLADFAPTEDAQ